MTHKTNRTKSGETQSNPVVAPCLKYKGGLGHGRQIPMKQGDISSPCPVSWSTPDGEILRKWMTIV